jgi:hypothetical protein
MKARKSAKHNAARAKAAIVCLARGHHNFSDYDQLIARNRSIFETINRYRSRHYPLVIWHEGNISSKHRRYILAREANRDVRFVDVSLVFQAPDWVAGGLQEDWLLGYRLMCRFHIYYVWQYANEFVYVMRLDDDCILRSVAADPIEWLAATGRDFGAAAFVAETHALTNRTLPHFVADCMKVIHPSAAQALDLYNQGFPYTNLYVTRTAFWLQPHVQWFLYAAISQPESIRFRWGDLPVLGVALNAFSVVDRVGLIPGLVYQHESHHATIVSG